MSEVNKKSEKVTTPEARCGSLEGLLIWGPTIIHLHLGVSCGGGRQARSCEECVCSYSVGAPNPCYRPQQPANCGGDCEWKREGIGMCYKKRGREY